MPDIFRDWPSDTGALTPDEVVRMYQSGYIGAKNDPEARERRHDTMRAMGMNPDGAEVAQQYGLADSYAGKLVLPFLAVEQCYPGCLPGAAQQRGDCVSHSSKNAALTTMCCEVVGDTVDEVTGLLEEAPEIPAEGIRDGALSTEAIYWMRGYNGDGWSCDTAAEVMLESMALWPRKNYPDLGIDLTRYSSRLAGKYGSTRPPANILAEGKKYLIRNETDVSTFEQARDFLGNGYGLTTCGGEGYSSSRDENGVSKRSGGWSHAMALIGADDRDEIKAIYNEPLVLNLNSWGKWNDGPRRILGTTIDIPEGSMWIRWSEYKRRQIIAMSGANGFPRRNLPDWGFNYL